VIFAPKISIPLMIILAVVSTAGAARTANQAPEVAP